jgi:hypothetical protein
MSTINYTYNVIVDRFRQFADGHFQLRRFTHGEISQADLEKEAEWPWMHVKPRAINYAPGTRAFSFEIFISDLPRDKEDKTGYQAESITDCSLIFQDLINEIHLGHMFGDDVLLTRPVNSEPFVEQYTHTLTGVTGIIELNMDYDWSACSIPASWNYNTPTNSNSSGFGSLQFIESLEQNGVFVSLDNDVEAPGNSYYYGTNGSGVKGWYASQAAAGTVTSVGLTAGTGISVSGGPITSSGSITVTNSAPDQVVALTAGTGIGVTGTYPNFTVTNSAPSSGGTVTAVTATSPISSTGGATPNLSMSSANGTTNGYLLSSDWLIFNGKFNTPTGTTLQYLRGDGSLATFPTITSGTVTSVAALTLGTSGADLSSTVANGTTTPVITLNVPTASAANRGALSAADWTTFNGKQDALGFTAENTANKQNSLAVDGTGVKFPTVDAVNNLSFIDKFKRGLQYFTDYDNTASSTPNFTQFSSGAGASVIRQVTTIPNATTNQIGFAQFQTGTTATGYITQTNEGFVAAQFFFGGGAWVFETFVNVETLSDASNRFRFISGFGNAPTNGAEGNGAFFTYDEGATQNGTATSPNWQTQTCVGSVRTLTTTTSVVTAGAWVKLRIEVNAAATSVTFYVNGTLVATHTTNIPTWVSPSNPRGFNVKQTIAKTIGLTSRSVFCDYLGYENVLTTPR